MKVDVQVVNAFVDAGLGGNPAGVVLGAEAYSQNMKQAIAAKAALSETAFVSPSSTADFKLEFFTPNRQIPHCGHATVATFSYLASLGKVPRPETSKETVDGRREIFISGDMAFMQQAAPEYLELNGSIPGADVDDVLNSIGLTRDDLRIGAKLVVVNNGVKALIIPLKDEAALRRITPDFTAINQISEILDLVEYYAFSTETQVPGRVAGTRMFAPRFGINEESATGMAAGALAAYMNNYLGMKQSEMIIEQGRLMTPASPSELHAKIETRDGRVTRTLVGGRAKVIKTITVEI